MRVVSRLKNLIAEKGTNKSRLSRASDVSLTSINNLADNQEMTSFDGRVIGKICKVLNCQISDILVLEDLEDTEK